jgi:galactokinase
MHNPAVLSVPGRVNLIGEHIDYHQLPVLPIAIQRQVKISFSPRVDRLIRAVSAPFGEREFLLAPDLEPYEPGDWGNYVKAAAQCVARRWHLEHGIDATVESDLPAAAGLSSSSALLTAFTLALLRANSISPGFDELMEVLPDGEQFVGTRGGGMDHAAVLASRAGCALLINFAPLSAEPVPIPGAWKFLIAHSLVAAEKSSELAAEYNARRTAGQRALDTLGLMSYSDDPLADASRLTGDELNAFSHVSTESARVRQAVEALRDNDPQRFGRLMVDSHESLRDSLKVSCPALDDLVRCAVSAGAFGARLTGAGFGGFAVILCDESSRDRIAQALRGTFYKGKQQFDAARHLFPVEPSDGALAMHAS